MKRVFNCPGELTVSLIGGRWKVILIYNLRRGPKRFGELRRLSPGISAATLAIQLDELEKSGLILREQIGRDPLAGVEYSLSVKGESLRPVWQALIRWGIANQGDHAMGEFGMAAFQR